MVTSRGKLSLTFPEALSPASLPVCLLVSMSLCCPSAPVAADTPLEQLSSLDWVGLEPTCSQGQWLEQRAAGSGMEEVNCVLLMATNNVLYLLGHNPYISIFFHVLEFPPPTYHSGFFSSPLLHYCCLKSCPPQSLAVPSHTSQRHLKTMSLWLKVGGANISK